MDTLSSIIDYVSTTNRIIYITLGVAAIVLVWWLLKKSNLSKKVDSKSDDKMVEHFTPPTNFHIYNHFPNHAITLDILPATSAVSHLEYGTNIKYSSPVNLIYSVAPKGKGGLTKPQVLKYLVRGNVLKISLFNPLTKEKTPLTDYMVDTDPDERIKNLHVGMITTRYIGGTNDTLNLTTTQANAGGGNAWLNIHNLTEVPLRLNDDIFVEPHSNYKYLGEFNQGITLGLYFKDPDGVYPTFQYLRPHSDIYYGVVSDQEQSLYGCWQQEYTDGCEYGQTMWPLQEGVM